VQALPHPRIGLLEVIDVRREIPRSDEERFSMDLPLGRRTFMLMASSALVGCAARATSAPVAGAADGAPTAIGPSDAWDGSPGSGYASKPTDPVRTTAKPAIRMVQAWGQRFAGPLVIGVDSEAVGGVDHVTAYVEGNSVILKEAWLTDRDVNNKPRTRIGYWISLSLTPAQLAAHPTGKIDVYFKATAKDPTMQERVIGPYRFYPRTTEFSGTYNIAASGAGGAYTTLKTAFQAAISAKEEAPRFHFTETAFYEMEDSQIFNTYTGGRGFWVIDAAPGITATLGRSTFPYGINQGAAGSYWGPGVPGLEFRGSGIVLDYKNIMYIDSPTGAYFDGLERYPRGNGCTFDSSLGTISTYYWNGTNRPVAALFSTQTFLEDCVIKHIGSPLGGTWVASNNRVLDTLGEIAPNCAYAAYNYINGWNPWAFFSPTDCLTISYSGAGVGRMWVNGGTGNNASMHFSVDGVEITTGGFPIPMSYFTRGTNHNISEVVAMINAHGGGWASTALVPDGPNAAILQGVKINPGADGVSNPTPVGNAASPSIARVSYDFHQDFWHSINQTGHGTDQGTIIRSNTIIGEGYFNGTPPAFIRGDTGVKDIMILENCVAHANSFGFGGASSHVYTRGNSWGEGWTPGQEDATYSLFEANVGNIYWQTGSILSPVYKDNYLLSETASGATTALSGALHSGNVIVAASGYGDVRAKLQAVFTNADAGDFRPTGGLLIHLKARSRKKDAFGTVFSATDARGAISVNTPRQAWPF
jgi:hypothetical protein